MPEYIVLDELFPLQAGLDADIHSRHTLTYPGTHSQRVLALMVELGEFANETRCFKFWSEKGPSPKEKILDEYADGLHFLLSLGIELGVEHYSHALIPNEDNLTLQILRTYRLASKLLDSEDPHDYANAFSSFLNIIPLLGYSGEEVIEAYKKKLAVNYQRQENHY